MKFRKVLWQGNRPVRGYVREDLPESIEKTLHRLAIELTEMDEYGVSLAWEAFVHHDDFAWTVGRFERISFTSHEPVGELNIDGYKFEVWAVKDTEVWHRPIVDAWIKFVG